MKIIRYLLLGYLLYLVGLLILSFIPDIRLQFLDSKDLMEEGKLNTGEWVELLRKSFNSNDIDIPLILYLQKNKLNDIETYYHVSKGDIDTLSCAVSANFEYFFEAGIGNTCLRADESGKIEEILNKWNQWLEEEFPKWAEENLTH